MSLDKNMRIIPHTSDGHVDEPETGTMVPYGQVSLHKLAGGRVVVRCIKAVDVVVSAGYFDQLALQADIEKAEALALKAETEKIAGPI